jgi:probable HAF family extracellular repeat protein
MKHTISIRRMSVFLALGATLCCAFSSAQNSTFTVSVLPDIAGGAGTYVYGISAGVAVGLVCTVAATCPTTEVVIWKGLTPTVLGAVPGEQSTRGFSINTAGQVAGITVDGMYGVNPTDQQAVVWNNGTPTLLTTVGPANAEPYVTQINDSGQVVGNIGVPAGTEAAVVWNGTTPTLLELLPGYTGYSFASGINNSGLIVGSIFGDDNAYYSAVVWHGTTPTALPTFSSKILGSRAFAVNDSGLVVGLSAVPGGSSPEAVAWANGVITSLGTLGGRSAATALNDRGIIVGYSDTPDEGQHAVAWSRIDATIEDLKTLISPAAAQEVVLTQAMGIDNNCSIVANGYSKSTKANLSFLLILNDASKCMNGGF